MGSNPTSPTIKLSDFYRAINMDRSYTSSIQGGNINATLAVLEKFGNALNVSVDDLCLMIVSIIS